MVLCLEADYFSKMKYIIALLLSLSAILNLQAQEQGHNVAVLIGHNYLSQGADNGNLPFLAVPVFVFDYNYRFGEHWGIGLHNDLSLESYEVINGDDELLQRSTPWASAIVLNYFFHERFSISLGAGVELEENENLFLIRTGFEYAYPLTKNFEFVSGLTMDFKPTAHNNFSLQAGVCYLFGGSED